LGANVAPDTFRGVYYIRPIHGIDSTCRANLLADAALIAHCDTVAADLKEVAPNLERRFLGVVLSELIQRTGELAEATARAQIVSHLDAQQDTSQPGRAPIARAEVCAAL
jgi:hypothetical protein